MKIKDLKIRSKYPIISDGQIFGAIFLGEASWFFGKRGLFVANCEIWDEGKLVRTESRIYKIRENNIIG